MFAVRHIARLGLAITTIVLSTAPLRAQVIQLPTFRQFATSSSVLVPDRGAALLGGNASARSYASQVGSGLAPFGPTAANRGLGRASSTAQATAHAWIHDLDAQDRRLLAADPSRNPTLARRASSDDSLSSRSSPLNPRFKSENLARRLAAARSAPVDRSIKEIERDRAGSQFAAPR